MINGISSSSQVAELYQTQPYQHNTHAPKNTQGDQQPQDTVVLSKQAAQSADVDHDGDSH